MADLTFTVFTATYNRAATLPRVYASLQAQSYRNFEWIIVDDGSGDNTRELVHTWRPDFPVRYFYQANSGKHVGFNRGVNEARGSFFLNLDSDDEAAPAALSRFAVWCEGLTGDYAGVGALCITPEGAILGDEFPESPLDSSRGELRYRYKVTGDKWLCQRTEVLRRFPFPAPEGVRFVQERTVLARMAVHYRTRYVNENLKIVHPGPARLSDNLRQQHPFGLALGQRSMLNHELKWLRYAPETFLRSAANYTRLSLSAGVGFAEQWRGLENKGAQALWLAALPLGIYLRRRDKAELQKQKLTPDTSESNRGQSIR